MTRALRIEYKEAQAGRELPALRQLAYRPALEAIRAAVDGPFMQDRAMTRRVEVFFGGATPGSSSKKSAPHTGWESQRSRMQAGRLRWR